MKKRIRTRIDYKWLTTLLVLIAIAGLLILILREVRIEKPIPSVSTEEMVGFDEVENSPTPTIISPTKEYVVPTTKSSTPTTNPELTNRLNQINQQIESHEGMINTFKQKIEEAKKFTNDCLANRPEGAWPSICLVDVSYEQEQIQFHQEQITKLNAERTQIQLRI